MNSYKHRGPWKGPLFAVIPVWTIAGQLAWGCLVEYREVYEREAGYPWNGYEWRRAL